MIELTKVIEELRGELSHAMEAGKSEPLQFEVASIQLELSVAVEQEAGASGKVRFYVLELGGEAKAKSGTTQKVTLSLDPKVQGSSERPKISGPSLPGEV